MNKADCKLIVEQKGGHILEKRTVYKGLKIGENFRLKGQPHWKHTYSILFFYKDEIFDYYAFICGWDLTRKEMILVSYSMVQK